MVLRREDRPGDTLTWAAGDFVPLHGRAARPIGSPKIVPAHKLDPSRGGRDVSAQIGVFGRLPGVPGKTRLAAAVGAARADALARAFLADVLERIASLA